MRPGANGTVAFRIVAAAVSFCSCCHNTYLFWYRLVFTRSLSFRPARDDGFWTKAEFRFDLMHKLDPAMGDRDRLAAASSHTNSPFLRAGQQGLSSSPPSPSPTQNGSDPSTRTRIQQNAQHASTVSSSNVHICLSSQARL